MYEEPLTTGELLEQWREATRAAELAERLARLARASVDRSDKDAVGAAQIARLAEDAAKHAERTAKIAREAADRAVSFAAENRTGSLAEAEEAVVATRQQESTARDAYHEAERVARDRHPSEGNR